MNEGQKYIDRLNEEYLNSHIFEEERDRLIAENNIENSNIRNRPINRIYTEKCTLCYSVHFV